MSIDKELIDRKVVLDVVGRKASIGNIHTLINAIKGIKIVRQDKPYKLGVIEIEQSIDRIKEQIVERTDKYCNQRKCPFIKYDYNKGRKKCILFNLYLQQDKVKDNNGGYIAKGLERTQLCIEFKGEKVNV